MYLRKTLNMRACKSEKDKFLLGWTRNTCRYEIHTVGKNVLISNNFQEIRKKIIYLPYNWKRKWMNFKLIFVIDICRTYLFDSLNNIKFDVLGLSFHYELFTVCIRFIAYKK